MKAVPKKGPAILVANHVSFFDILWVYSLLRRPLYLVATEDLFRKPLLAYLIRWTGTIPKRKAATDMPAVRNMFQIVKAGGLLGLFVEGSRTWDGLNNPIPHAIVPLLQRMKVPVFACRQEGGYLAMPRWARKYRRLPVRAYYSLLWDGPDIPEDGDEIVEKITARLRNRDYELAGNYRAYRRKGLASDLGRLVYRCPDCRTFESLRVVKPISTNRVECGSCFSTWEVTLSCRLVPVNAKGEAVGSGTKLADVHKQILSFPLTPSSPGYDLELEKDEKLYLQSRVYTLKKELVFPKIGAVAVGRLYLTDRRLIFQSSKKRVLDMPLSRVSALSTEPGDRFHFVYDKTMYHIAFRNESILKWFDIILKLQKEKNIR